MGSLIEWTDETWNPTKGCSKVSPGCKNCYAIRMAHRIQATGHKAYQGVTKRQGGKTQWTGLVNVDRKARSAPLRWKKPRRVFVNSMSDLFHEKISDAFIAEVWWVMAHAPQHQFQLLTKRPERMLQMMNPNLISLPPLKNLWCGVSVENGEYLNRIETLKQVPAICRFVSFEPLLGSVQGVDLRGIHWAVVGGESGPGARAMKEEWVEEIEEACRRYGTAFFFKQWGGVNKKKNGRLFRGQEWNEMP